MVLTDLVYEIVIITTIIPVSYIQTFDKFNVYETSLFISIMKNVHLLVVYFINQIIPLMGIQRISVIFNKSNWFTKPVSMAIICICFIIFNIIVIVLRRISSFNRWINFASLFIEICYVEENPGIIESIANIFFYTSYGTPIVILVLLLITYYKLKKAKASIHIAEKNEAIAIENGLKENDNNLKTVSPITSSKNMKNLLRKYEIEAEKQFLIQQMILCITVSIGSSGLYVHNPLLQIFGRTNLIIGFIRTSTCQLSFSSLSICLIIFNRSIRDDIIEVFRKICSH